MILRIPVSDPKAVSTSTAEELLDVKGQVLAEGKLSREADSRKGIFIVEGKSDLDELINKIHSLRLPGQAPALVIRAIPVKGEPRRLDLIFSVMA